MSAERTRFPGFDAFARGESAQGYAWGQVPTVRREEEGASLLRRLLFAGPVRTAGMLAAVPAEVIATAGALLEAGTGGAVRSPVQVGETTALVEDLVRKHGGLTGAPAEQALTVAGDIVRAAALWKTGVGALAGGAKGLAGAAGAARLAKPAATLTKLAETARTPATLAQRVGREAGVAALQYPVLEMTRDEQDRMHPAAYIATAFAGGALDHGIEKLLALRAANAARATAGRVSAGADQLSRDIGGALAQMPTPHGSAAAATASQIPDEDALEQALHAYAQGILEGGVPADAAHRAIVDRLVGPSYGHFDDDAKRIATELVATYGSKTDVPSAKTAMPSPTAPPVGRTPRAATPATAQAPMPVVVLDDELRAVYQSRADILENFWGSKTAQLTEQTSVDPLTGKPMTHTETNERKFKRKTAEAKRYADAVRNNTLTPTMETELNAMWGRYATTTGVGTKKAKELDDLARASVRPVVPPQATEAPPTTVTQAEHANLSQAPVSRTAPVQETTTPIATETPPTGVVPPVTTDPQEQAITNFQSTAKELPRPNSPLLARELGKLEQLGVDTQDVRKALQDFTGITQKGMSKQDYQTSRKEAWEHVLSAVDDITPNRTTAVPEELIVPLQSVVAPAQDAVSPPVESLTNLRNAFEESITTTRSLQNEVSLAKKEGTLTPAQQETLEQGRQAVKQNYRHIRTHIAGLLQDENPTVAAQARLLDAALGTRPKMATVEKVLQVQATEPVPGNESWNRAWRELFPADDATKSTRETIETEYWDNLANKLTAEQPENARKTYTEVLRNLPEAAQYGTPSSVIAANIRKRGVHIGDDLDYVLRDLPIEGGAPVTAEQLKALSKTDDRAFNVHELATRVKERGGTVVGEELLHAGVTPKAVWDNLKKIMGHKNTAETFVPIQDVTVNRRSLSADNSALLSDAVAGQLDRLDNDLATVNLRMRNLVTDHGHFVEMPPEIRAQFDALLVKLRKVGDKRDKLLPVVEIELGDARKGLFGRSVLADLNKGKLVSDSLPRFDAAGNHIDDIILSPIKGVEVILDHVPDATKADELMLRKGVSLYAQRLAAVRDIFGDVIAIPWRNAVRAHKYFMTEVQDELFDILQPILKTKDEGARLRITDLLEGNLPPNATQDEVLVGAKLRAWYDRLFTEFGIDPERRLPNYAPKIPVKGAIAQPPLPDAPPKELSFFAELARMAQEEGMPFERDALQAALTYLHLGSRKKFFQPVKDMVRPYTHIMHPTRKNVYEAFENSILNRPIWEDRLIDNTTTEALRLLNLNLGKDAPRLRREVSVLTNRLIYASTISANPMTAAKNLTQIFIPIGALDGNPVTGLKYHARAVRDLFTQEGKDLIKQHCSVLQDRIFFEGQDLQSTWLAGLQGAERIGMLPMQMTDRLNVSASFMMKLRHAIEVDKKPFATAVQEANKFALDTQFGYGMDSPMLYKTDFGRAIGILASWPLNYVNLLYKYGSKSGWEGKKKVGMMLLAGTVGAQLMSQATGLDFSSTSPHNAIVNWLPMSVMVSGTLSSIPIEMTRASIGLAQSMIAGTDTEKREALDTWLDNAQNYVPLNTPLRRIARSTRALLDDGAVYDEQGKLKYRMSPGEVARSFVGPTVEARERWDDASRLRVIEQDYRKLRRDAIQAYLAQDAETFNRLQQQLRQQGGTPVRRQDITQALRHREMPATERQAMGVPEQYAPRDSAQEKAWRWLLDAVRGR